MVMKLAGCVIKNENGEMLLLHRNTPKRVEWELPGGKLEDSESYEAAAIREIKEELGVDVVIKRRLGGDHFTREDGTFYYEWFEAEITEDNPKIQESHIHDKLAYFSLAEISTPTLSGNLAQLRQNILDGTVKL